jgi:hypothetical protein
MHSSESAGYSIGFKCRCSRKLYVRVTTEPFSENTLDACPSIAVEPILHALSFDDVGRLLRLEGLAAERIDRSLTGGPGWRTSAEPRFDAVPYFESTEKRGRSPFLQRGQAPSRVAARKSRLARKGERPLFSEAREYRALWLTASFRLSPADAAAVLEAVAPLHAQGHIALEADGSLTVVQSIVVAGGVTEAHLQFQLRAWLRILQQVTDCAGGTAEDGPHD